MSVNLTDGTIPFTELSERCQTLARLESLNNEDFTKGLVNDTYVFSIPRIEDWRPLVEESTLAMTACYNTGTIAVNAGSASVTGTGTTWTSTMTAANGWRIKIAGQDIVYKFTYASGTTATISPVLAGATNISGASYVVYQEEYQLASDFDRFLKNGSIYVMSGGRLQDTIMEVPHDQFREDYYPDVQDPIRRCILSKPHATTGYKTVRINPPPRTAKAYPYEYIKKLTRMREYTTGTVSVTSGSADVTGSGTSWLANVTVGDFFRIDSTGTGDSSKWYRVLSIASDTSLTLTANYGESTESGAEYSISTAPSALPSEFHEFLLYEAVLTALGTQDDPAIEMVGARRNDILKDLKKNYKMRRTNVQYGVDDDGYR